MDDLRERVTAYEPENEQQERARHGFLFLVEAARTDYPAAAMACEELLKLCEQDASFDYESKWPEVPVAYRGLQNPAMRAIVSDLCSQLFAGILTGRHSGSTTWDHQLASLHGLQRRFEMDLAEDESDEPSTVGTWFPGSLHTVASRAAGAPRSYWRRNGPRVDKLSPHSIDLMYYRLPLRGNFDVECDATVGAMENTGLMFGGHFYAMYSRTRFDEGTIHTTQENVLDGGTRRRRRFGLP